MVATGPRYALVPAIVAFAIIALIYGVDPFLVGVAAFYVALLYYVVVVWIWALRREYLTPSKRALRIGVAAGLSLAALYLAVIGLAE